MSKYLIKNKIGCGAFGIVYLCQHQGNSYAMKTFEPSASVLAAIQGGQVQEEELRRRFVSEAKYQSHIDHPNVVRVIEANMDASPPYFIMELAEFSLADELKADPTFNGKPDKVLYEILLGLEAIHSQGIYHRDLKPANVLKIRNGDGTYRYAISDFGLMKSTVGDSTTLTATGTQGGTQRYAAPELMANFKRATARSDIFSFGVILQDFFAPHLGRIPFTEVQIPGAIGKIASKCTKTVAVRRYGSVGELRADLYEAIKNDPPVLTSNRELSVAAALESDTELTEQQWDQVFLLLEDEDIPKKAHRQVLRLFTKDHLTWLEEHAPDLLSAYGGYFCDYLDASQGDLDFDFCDVAGDKLEWLFELGDVAQQARSLISLMIMGASHNRWYVERKFQRLAGVGLPEPVAQRFITEIDVKGITASDYILQIERSIGVSKELLHPILHEIWE